MLPVVSNSNVQWGLMLEVEAKVRTSRLSSIPCDYNALKLSVVICSRYPLVDRK